MFRGEVCSYAAPVRDARLPSDSGKKQICQQILFFALAPVHPCCSRRFHALILHGSTLLATRSAQHPRAGQQRHTQTEKRAGYSPAAFSAECGAVGRCEGCEHDTKSAPVPAHNVLPLVSSVTGGSRPGHVPGSSGVVPPGAICRALAPNAPLSEQPLTRLFSVYAILMGTLYHLGVKMSRGVERHCQTKSLPCVKGGGPTQVGSEGLSGPRYRQPLSQP